MASASAKLVDMVAARRSRIRRSLKSYVWAPVHIITACFIYSELINGYIHGIPKSSITRNAILSIELFTMVIFAGNVTYHLYQIVWLKFLMKPIELTSEQMILFRVYSKEPGFMLQQPKPIPDLGKKVAVEKTPKFSLSPPSYDSLSRLSSAENSVNTSFNGSNVTYGSGNVGDTASSSWWFQGSSQTPKYPSNSELPSGYSLRKRITPSRLNTEPIASPDSLNGYLNKFDDQQLRSEEIARHESNSSLANDHMSLANLSTGGRSPAKYQAADDSVILSSENDMSVDSSSFSPSRSRDSMLSLLSLNETRLNQCVENIRTWISNTILSRIVAETDRVNGQLIQMGFADVIGEAGLSSLRQLSQMKSGEIPSLPLLVPYFELSPNQEYLVSRIKELSRGGAIHGFNWNSGCSHRNKAWSEDLPTDAAIIMHLFCCYMNSRLPAAPNCPEGKSFTSQYFKPFKSVVSPSSTSSPPKTSIGHCIVENKINPPHYTVTYKDVDVCEVPAGRNNIFYALIIFLHCIKIKNHSLLGRTNLGPSGINILWVLND